jgi:hypothetical protein
MLNSIQLFIFSYTTLRPNVFRHLLLTGKKQNGDVDVMGLQGKKQIML